MKFQISVLPYLTLVAFFSASVALRYSTHRSSYSKQAYLNLPPEQIEHFALGFPGSLADGLWLRWIQDMDHCQTYGAVPASDAAVKSEGSLKPPCNQSWSFKMLDAITKLDARFKMPYMAGAITLSVLLEDFQGATRLFERAVENYPNDWEILYRAGYHEAFDTKNYLKAADYLTRAAEHGGPYWTRLLAARVLSNAGRAELGIATLTSYLETITDPEQRQYVEKRISDLRSGAH